MYKIIAIPENTYNDPSLGLTEDAFFHILAYLDINDLLSLTQTNQNFRAVATEVIRNRIRDDFGLTDLAQQEELSPIAYKLLLCAKSYLKSQYDHANRLADAQRRMGWNLPKNTWEQYTIKSDLPLTAPHQFNSNNNNTVPKPMTANALVGLLLMNKKIFTNTIVTTFQVYPGAIPMIQALEKLIDIRYLDLSSNQAPPLGYVPDPTHVDFDAIERHPGLRAEKHTELTRTNQEILIAFQVYKIVSQPQLSEDDVTKLKELFTALTTSRHNPDAPEDRRIPAAIKHHLLQKATKLGHHELVHVLESPQSQHAPLVDDLVERQAKRCRLSNESNA